MRSIRPLLLVPVALVAASCAAGDADDSVVSTTPITTVVVETPAPADTASADTAPDTVTTVTTSATATATTTAGATSTSVVDDVADRFAAIDPIVADFVEERRLNGAGLVVVDADDGVIHEDYWGVFSADRISLVASSSKMIVAGVLLALQDEGVLDIDAPVAEVVDWGAGNPDITPAQLLSNSSGLVGLLPNPAYLPYLCQFIADGTLQECAQTVFETPVDDDDIVAPDTQFRYGGAQWQVAGAVAEVASGETWAELIDRIYVQPCGLDALAFNNHFGQLGTSFDYPDEFDADPSTLQPTANPSMEGGAYITTGDYAKLLLMHLRGGMCGDTRVLSEAAIAAAHRDRVAEVYDGDADIDTGYGLGWWIDRTSGQLSDAGAYGSWPWLDLEDGYGVYLVIEADSGTGNALASQLYDVIDEAVAAV